MLADMNMNQERIDTMADNSTSGAGSAENPQAVRAEYRIEIAAPPEAVWAVLGDLAGWSDWNPIYTAPVCVPRVGEAISAAVTMPGAPPNPFTAEISAWEPNRRLHWSGSVMDGQMTMTRYMEIEPGADGGSVFVNGEAFGGAMGPAIMKDLVAGIENGFRLMSEALKKAVEAR